jgi:hypothetical protein
VVVPIKSDASPRREASRGATNHPVVPRHPRPRRQARAAPSASRSFGAPQAW